MTRLSVIITTVNERAVFTHEESRQTAYYMLRGHESEQTPEIAEVRGAWWAAVDGVAQS